MNKNGALRKGADHLAVFAKDALAGEHALITGATGGIGKETAKAVAAMGASVTITGRREEALHEVKKEIENDTRGISVYAHVCDLTDADDRERLVASAERANGFISLLVNAAGISGGTTVDELTQEEMERIMHLNYTSTVLLTQRVYRKMKKKKKGGAVVNVSSLSGLRGTYGNTAYAASKFALIGFTHAMAVEAIRDGVRVNAVCPGYVDTEMGRAAIARRAEREGRTYAEQLATVNENLPSGRVTQPEEVANAIAFLLTDAAENIVGESVKISAGSVLR
ncbi:MAG TPA: SDR family oxidoreductase [Bacillales bacterium]|nr:SDR family oxidoreductase [Bacillales bacterium]